MGEQSLKGRLPERLKCWDGDGMAMHGGKTNEGREKPFSDVSQGGIIEAINLVKITRKGGELEDLGADGRGIRSEARALCSGIRIHHEEGNETLRRKPREDIYIYYIFLLV